MTEDTFTIRKAAPADLPRIHEIYAAARQFMRDHGNFSQWDGEDAPERLLRGILKQEICTFSRKQARSMRPLLFSSAQTHATR